MPTPIRVPSEESTPVYASLVAPGDALRFDGGLRHTVLETEYLEDDHLVRISMLRDGEDENQWFSVDFAPDTEVWKVVQ